MKRFLAVFLLISFWSIVNCQLSIVKSAHAQSPEFSLSISPTVLSANIDQGSEVEAKLIIKNTANKKLDLDISIKPIKADPAGNGNVILFDKTNDQEKALQEQIRVLEGDINITKVSLSQNETKELTLKISVPQQIQSGDYYFALIFLSSGSQTETIESSINVSAGIGMNLLLSVGGKNPIRGAIEEFSAPFFLTSGPVPFKLLFENLSANFIKPQGTITIYDMFGRKAGNINVGPNYVLGGSKRYLSDQKSKSNEVIWEEKFLFGLYNAKLTLQLSENGPTFRTSIYFLSLPLYLLIALSVFLFISIGIYLKIIRKIRKPGH